MTASRQRLIRSVSIVVALMATTSACATDHPVTVMTYNIGGYAYIPLEQPQMAQIAQEIVDAQADVVGMTEIDVGTRNGNTEFLDMIANWGPCP